MIDFDPADPAFRRAPHAFYRELRAIDPVHMCSSGYWVATRYDDVAALLTDRRFSNQFRGESPPDSGEPVLDLTRYWFNFYDPPDHTRVRRLLSRSFTPRAIDQLRQSAIDIASGLVDAVADRGEMDVVSDLAYPLPILVMAELLGVPREDRALLRPWLGDLHAVFDLAPPPDAISRGRESVLALVDYFEQLGRDWRARGSENLMNLLSSAVGRPDGITAAELPATCILLLFAGYETTTSLISGGLAALLSSPEEQQRLRQSPQLMDGAIEEMLRFVSPTQFVMRRAREDVAMRGKVIPRDATIRLILAAANRDPAVYVNPDVLDIRRHPNPHLALGNGIHVCIGGPLSKMNTTVAFETLMRRFAKLETSGSPQTIDNLTLPNYESFLVRLTPA